MKKLLVTTALVATLGVNTYGSWFRKDREQELEQKLQKQEEKACSWQTATFMLGVSCVILLIAGVAIGSKAKRDGM